MAIILRRDAEPNWIDLGNGAALLCVPPTSALVHAARLMADAVMIDLAAAGEAVTRVGGHIIGVPDLSSEREIDGTRQTLVLVSLAELAARDWRGVLDDHGAPLKFQPSFMALLLSDQAICDRFSRAYLQPLHEVVAEGNVSRPLPTGTSGRAGEKATAKAARHPAKHARPRTRATASTPNKPH